MLDELRAAGHADLLSRTTIVATRHGAYPAVLHSTLQPNSPTAQQPHSHDSPLPYCLTLPLPYCLTLLFSFCLALPLHDCLTLPLPFWLIPFGRRRDPERSRTNFSRGCGHYYR